MKLITSVFLSFICLAMNAQEYTVGTEVQKKSVLLETFVGTRCKWSGQAPDFVNKIESVLGERLNAVTVHCGRLSDPAWEGDTDYTTPEGNDIATLLAGIDGSFPNGAINRHNWNSDGQLTFSRFDWASRSRQASHEDAPVNLWAKAQYDASTRQLSVRVEGYFTGEVIAAQQRLQVLLTENNFVGDQKTPDGFYNDFVHQHLLRTAITGSFGELIPDCKPHHYFVREYVYNVPEAIKNVPLNPAELELVIFVTGEDSKHVHNSISVKPTYTHLSIPVTASIGLSGIPVTEGYLFDFFPLVMHSRCDTEITSATFEVSLNASREVVEWTGRIGAFQNAQISLPIHWEPLENDLNTYMVKLLSINGQPTKAKVILGEFNGHTLVTPKDLQMKIHTSPDHPEDYTYTLFDVSGKTIQSFGPYTANTDVEEVLHLTPGQSYCLEIADAWGNGYIPEVNVLELYDRQGNLLQSLDRVKGFGARVFFTVQSESLPVNTTFGQNVHRALATFSAPYPTTPSNHAVAAYYAEKKDASTVVLRQIVPQGEVLVVPANVGVVLTTPDATAFQMNATALPAASVDAANLLQATGAHGMEVSTTENAYILGKKSTDLLFHVLSASDRHVAANRAYLRLPSSLQTTSIKMVFDDEATGIEQTPVHPQNAAIYDLSGRKVAAVVKGGIYLQNGKKFIVK